MNCLSCTQTCLAASYDAEWRKANIRCSAIVKESEAGIDITAKFIRDFEECEKRDALKKE